MTRALPEFATLALVTPLLLLYGSTDWSWVAGPVASLAIWALDLGRSTSDRARRARAPAPA